MAVNLTSGAISKIVTGKCTSNDLKPVLQVIRLVRGNTSGKQWHLVMLSDGSFVQLGCIPVEIYISNKLQIGSIVQLTNFQLGKLSDINGEIIIKSGILVWDLNLCHTTCDVIGDPDILPDHETLLVERTTPTISDEDHANSHHVDEPTTSKQKPSTSTQKCSSHSPTRNKKRKLQSSDDAISISGFEKDISKLVSMIVEKTIEDSLGACHEKLGTLEEGVSNMTRMMMEKSKEVDAGFKKMETLEQDVSKMKKMVIEKNKEDDVGACFKKLEALKEDVSEMSRMMMKIYKEDDMGACIEKLEKIGWVAQDPMYDTAILLFGQSADYRKLWLHLKPESCGNWVKNAESMFGLLD